MILKTVYHIMNIASLEAELFTIRCGINYATQLQDISCIVIITDAISAARKIFDLNIHPQQLHSITISKDLSIFQKELE